MEELNTVVTFCEEKHWHWKQPGAQKSKGKDKEIPIQACCRLRIPGGCGSQIS
jgi:hypothetical protein